MRPPVRLLRPLEAPSLRNSKKALYVCSNCRYDASLLSSSSLSQQHHQSRRHAGGSGSTPFTEKLRRRLWGTDKPPGLEDPYGGEGVIAKNWSKRKAQYMKEQGREVPEEEEEEVQQSLEASKKVEENDIPEEDEFPEFQQVTKAHDLPRMGHLGEWRDLPPSENDTYYSFLSREKAKTSAHFRSAAQSVAVELSLLQELKKPLSLACEVSRHHESIWEMIEQCQIKESSNTIKFPDEQTKENLFFVFNQLGEVPEVETAKEPAEAAAQADTEAVTKETTEAEGVAAAETEIEAVAEEVEEVEEVQEDDGSVYSYALNAKQAPAHAGYLSFSLADPAVKFAFLKRYSQITGHHMQDSNVHAAKTVQDIVEHLEKTLCRPRKLAHELEAIKAEFDLPNVHIRSKRWTKHDHDREIGRAKLIEQALRERGLLKENSNKQDRFSL